jgi:DnaJ-class molecular chaperone
MDDQGWMDVLEDTIECPTCFGNGTVFGITCGGCEGIGFLHTNPPSSVLGSENV